MALNAKIERLINILQRPNDLADIKELLEEANRLKEFELKMKYPERFESYKLLRESEQYKNF